MNETLWVLLLVLIGVFYGILIGGLLKLVEDVRRLGELLRRLENEELSEEEERELYSLSLGEFLKEHKSP